VESPGVRNDLPEESPANLRREGPAELRAERAFRIWVLVILVVAAILVLALKIFSRDINQQEPTIDSRGERGPTGPGSATSRGDRG
jgi:hypothetical protein